MVPGFLAGAIVCMVGSEMGDIAAERGLSSVCFRSIQMEITIQKHWNG